MNRLSELMNDVAKSFNKEKVIEFFTRQDVFMNSFILYNKIVSKINTHYNHVYVNYPVAKSIIDRSSYFIKFVYAKIIQQRIEPIYADWISTSILSRRDPRRFVGEEYTLLESYEFMKNPFAKVDDEFLCEANYNELSDIVDSLVLNNRNYVEGLVKMKIHDKYVYRIFNNTRGHFTDFSLPIFSSNVKFLSIEYSHPMMKTTIPIELSRSVFNVDNVILSQTFIKSYLEYQSQYYHFDMDYVVKIMDNDVNTFEIKSNESILLLENTYQVIQIEK